MSGRKTQQELSRLGCNASRVLHHMFVVWLVWSCFIANGCSRDDDRIESQEAQEAKRSVQSDEVLTSGRRFDTESTEFEHASLMRVVFDDAEVCDGWCFSPDGRFLYLLEKGGILRKITVPEFVEARQLAIGTGGRRLQSSSEGVLVLGQEDEMWLVAPEDLSVTRRIATEPVPERLFGRRASQSAVVSVVTSPALPWAYVFYRERGVVAAVDLRTGDTVRWMNARELTGPPDAALPDLDPTGTPRVTCDGRYLFLHRSGGEHVHRLWVNGPELEYDGAVAGAGLRLSRDSRYVAAADRSNQHSTIYATDDLNTPVARVYGRFLGFDPAARLVYRWGSTDQRGNAGLLIAGADGFDRRSVTIGRAQASARVSLQAHPAGRRALVLVEKGLDSRDWWWVELAEPGRPAAVEPVSAPRPELTGASLLGVPWETSGATVSRLDVDDVTAVRWSADAGSIYLLQAAGVVRKVRGHDGSEERRLDLGHPAALLDRSAEDLVVYVTDREELWMLDPETLEFRRSIVVGPIQSIVAAEGLSHLFVVATGSDAAVLSLVDLEEPRIVSQIDLRALSTPSGLSAVGVKWPTMTPDGRYLLCSTGSGVLHRFHVAGNEVSYDGTLNPLVAADDRFAPIVNDDRLLLRQGADGAVMATDRGLVRVDDWEMYDPPVPLPGSGVADVHLGRERAYIAAPIIIKDFQGRLLKRIELRSAGRLRSLLAHDSGGLIVVHGRAGHVHWVKVADIATPEPLDTGRDRTGRRKRVVDLELKAVALGQNPAGLMAAWSSDGDAFFTLDEGGVLRRITAPGLREERRLEIDGRCTSLAPSAPGLLVLVESIQEVWVIDEKALEIRKTIPVGRCERLISHRESSVAYARLGMHLAIIDLQGERIRSVGSRDLVQTFGSPRMNGERLRPLVDLRTPLEVSPDGEYLVAGIDTSHLFRIDGVDLHYEEVRGKPTIQSSDLSRPADVAALDLHARAPGRGLVIEGHGGRHRLQRIVRAGGQPPRLFGLAQDHAGVRLLELDSSGTVLRDRALGRLGGEVREFLVHERAARGLLQITDSVGRPPRDAPELWFVDLPEADAEPGAGIRPGVRRKPLATERTEVVGGHLTRLEVGPGKLLPCAAWSTDGQFAYLLDETGLVRRISVPALVEDGRLEIGGECRTLFVTAAGVVVHCSATSELWLLDADTLVVTARVPVGEIRHPTAAADGTLVFYVAPAVGGPAWGDPDSHELVVLDLETREVVSRLKTIEARMLRAPGVNVHPSAEIKDLSWARVGALAAVSDPPELLCHFEGSLYRFTLDEARLVPASVGPRLPAKQVPAHAVLHDSQGHVFNYGDGKSSPNDHPIGSCYVYGRTDLQTPVLTLPWSEGVIDYDAAHGRFLVGVSVGASRGVVPVSDRGLSGECLRMGARPLQVLAQADGKGVLCLTREDVWWAEPDPLAPGSVDVARTLPRPVAGAKEQTGAARLTVWDLPSHHVPSRAGRRREWAYGIQEMAWSRDGESALLLDETSLVRRVGLDGREDRQFHAGRVVRNLSISRTGVILIAHDAQQVWVLDHDRLEPRRQVAVSGIRDLAAAPASSIVFASVGDRRTLVMLDLESGREVRRFEVGELSRDRPGLERHPDGLALEAFEGLVLSPDGRVLVCTNRGCLHFFAVGDSDLSYTHAGPQLARHDPWFQVSTDSRFVLAQGDGLPPRDHGHPGPGGAYVYRLDAPLRPARLIEGRGRWSLAGSRHYCQDRDRLRITDAAGEEITSLPLTSTSRLLIHPRGQTALLLSPKDLRLLELDR